MSSESLALTPAIEQLDRETQNRYDLQTQFAELVDGPMCTDFELRLEGDDLVGEDGRNLRAITEKSLAEAKVMARLIPELWFEVRRRGYEQDEIDEAVKMARGEGPNTMVIESDFPAELEAATEDVGGYNIRRRQTMQRILMRTGPGKIRMYSQTLDGSNRVALEAIYARLDETPEPGELLPQRIRRDLTEEEQANLNDELRTIYDQSLAVQFGGEWYGGRRPADYRNTYDFVCAQTDLIDECARLHSIGWLTEETMYKMSAAMQRRFEIHQLPATILVDPASTLVSVASLHREIELAGRMAQLEGKSFSACGITIRADQFSDSTEDNMNQAGYGNKTTEHNKCEFISLKCPECGAKKVKTKSYIKNGLRHVKGSCGCHKTYQIK